MWYIITLTSKNMMYHYKAEYYYTVYNKYNSTLVFSVWALLFCPSILPYFASASGLHKIMATSTKY